MLLTAAAAVLAGPAPDQAPGRSANGAAFDWAAAGGNGAAPAAHPNPGPHANINGAHANGLLNGAAANGNGASETGLVLPVQVRLFWRCMPWDSRGAASPLLSQALNILSGSVSC